MERRILLRVTAGGRLLATVWARPFGTDCGFVEAECDVTDQLPGVLAMLRGPEKPADPPKGETPPPED